MRDLANRLLPRPVVRGLRRPARMAAALLGWAEAADPALADLSGDGDWKAAGEAITLWARALCGVQPDAEVLEIGCGPGRMAEGLLGWLNAAGRYTGFDPSMAAIASAQKRVGSDDRARFLHADLFNAEYNPRGTLKDSEFGFPVADNTLDFAFATSVFTHMRIAGVARYIDEVARCLKPGGTFLFTAFLLDPDARVAMATGRAAYRFSDPLDALSATIDARTPERAIAHEREAVLGCLGKADLTVEGEIHAGTWRGLDHAMAFQDLIVARKPVS
ncbi:class I SAM-dependent methyltransferase [Hyphobacterium sp.]|uniref:class I SAM-dependent methyltransferase n=1 Tax=Hyphobacterium sp. TaxID=2004662 RepID=UPI003B51DB17